MKKTALQLILVLFGFNSIAQNPLFHWAKSLSGGGSETGWSIALDSAKNVYTTGEFQNTVDFNPGISTYTLASDISGYADVFISKLDVNGNFVWARSFGGSYNDRGNAIATDLAGNVYVAGYYNGLVDFDPGPGTYTLSASASSQDMFILKLDANGDFVWARSIGGSSSDKIVSIAVSPSGTIYCHGVFQGAVDFDPGAGVSNLTSSGTSDLFILNLNTSGIFGWVKQIGNASIEAAGSIEIDASGNIYSTGTFINGMDADPGTGVYTLTPWGGSDAFLLKLDPLGNFMWAQNLGGTNGDDGLSIFPDNSGNVLISGRFLGNMHFTATYSITAVGGATDNDGFIAKYNPSGSFIWGNGIGSTAFDEAISVISDATGNVYVSGDYSGTVDFDPGASTYTLTNTNSSTKDIFILKLNANGNFIFASSMGGAYYDIALDMTIDGFGNIYNTGYYSGPADYDPTPATYNLLGGSTDVFVTKIGACAVLPAPVNTTNVSNQTICSGNTTTLSATGAPTVNWYSSSNPSLIIGTSSGSPFVTPILTAGTYTFVAYSSAACSSTNVTTQVTLTVVPTPTISVNSGSICAGQSFTIVPSGANSYSFTGGSSVVSPTINTSYTVTGLALNGCASNSVVTTITVSSMPVFTITPTPTLVCPGHTSNLTITGAPHVLWFNGSTANQVILTPSVSSAYSVTAYNSNYSCSTASFVTVNVDTPITLTVTGNNTVCLGSSVAMNVSGGASYYVLTPFQSSITATGFIITPTVTTNYTVSGSSGAGCSYSTTRLITVDSNCQDVWPGDANSDGLANNLDVLELGLHYTHTGAPRAITSNVWQSYFSNNWTGNITNGKNLNHSDCNGDGIIDDNDTLAIYNNYGLTHAFKPAQTNAVNPQLSIVPDQSSVAKGLWGTASIYLGDASTQISFINGVAFTVDFDNTLIEPTNIYIEYQNSFIDAGQNLHFRKLDFANGKLFTASTHTVNNNLNGYGKIATLHYQIKSNLATDQVLNIGLSLANQSEASGLITPLTSGTGTLMALGASVGLQELNGNIVSISPNPTNGSLTINSKTELQKIEVVSITGQTLLSEMPNNVSHVLHLDNFANGIYFVNVYQNDRIVKREKIVLNK